MKAADYSQGDAFQAEKRTIFSAGWLPLCAEAQIGKPGDFLAATVGGWGVVGVRGQDGAVRVLRNACRHQNMQVLRTRLLTHIFGGTADQHGQVTAIIKRVCERLQTDRAQGIAAMDSELVGTFHARLAAAYAQDRPTS